jgi:hypothetical protein
MTYGGQVSENEFHALTREPRVSQTTATMSPANNNLPAPAPAVEEQLAIIFKLPLLNYDNEVFDYADRAYDFDDFAEEFMPNMNEAAQLGVWRQIVAGQANNGFYLNPVEYEEGMNLDEWWNSEFGWLVLANS